MMQYRLVNSAWQYNKIGIVWGERQPPPSPEQIYKKGREILQKTIDSNSLKYNKDLIEKMENKLNDLNNFDMKIKRPDAQTEMTLLEYLAKRAQNAVTKTLAIIPSSSQEEGIAYLKAAEKYFNSQLGGEKKFDDLVKKLNKYLETADPEEDLTNDGFYQEILHVLESLNKTLYGNNSYHDATQILEIIQTETVFWKNKSLFRGQKKERDTILYHLEILKALLTGNIQQAAGDISEAYVEAVLEGLEYKVEEEKYKIIQSIQTGDSSSSKLMEKKLAKKYAYMAKEETKTFSGYRAYFKKPTKDKVDVELTTSENEPENKLQGLSVKNYSNPLRIGIFKGNLLTILGQDKYIPYTYYFLNSYTYNIDKKEKKPLAPSNLYKLMKEISAVHGLIGGLIAKNDKGFLITPTARYLLVNDSSKEQGWKVYSTKVLCELMIEHIDYYTTFSKEFNYPCIVKRYHKVISDEKHRFTNVQIELILQRLIQSKT